MGMVHESNDPCIRKRPVKDSQPSSNDLTKRTDVPTQRKQMLSNKPPARHRHCTHQRRFKHGIVLKSCRSPPPKRTRGAIGGLNVGRRKTKPERGHRAGHQIEMKIFHFFGRCMPVPECGLARMQRSTQPEHRGCPGGDGMLKHEKLPKQTLQSSILNKKNVTQASNTNASNRVASNAHDPLALRARTYSCLATPCSRPSVLGVTDPTMLSS